VPTGSTTSGRNLPAPAVERFFQFSLLGLVAAAFCALADTGRLDLPSLAFLLAGLVWRGFMSAGLLRLRIPQRLITVLATAYLVFYPLDFYFLSHDFFAATAHGVCFLGVARVLSARTNRDYLYTGSLAFVALLGAAALSTQLRFFGWLAAAIVFALGAMTSAEIRRGFQRTRTVPATTARAGARTVWILAILVGCAAGGILVLTVGLFLIVPRTARAAAMLFPNGPRLTGFTNSIDLGGFGPIAKDDRPVLHIHATAAPLPPNLKWRGSSLSRFDGRRWTEPPLPPLSSPAQGTLIVADLRQRSRRDGERMLYRVDVDASDTGTLFIAGIPEFINVVQNASEASRLVRTADDSFRALPATGAPLRYEVFALNAQPLLYPLSSSERNRYLALPFRLDARIPELGRTWSGTGPDTERATRIAQHLQRDFTYTLDADALPSRHDRLADFLFVTRRGYCEYFASAMAVLLRTQGIPSRVITGFQSGYYNDVSGSWVERASDAHAWVEGWLEGRGWVTFDPTPAGTVPTTSALLQRIGMYVDAADTVWQQWVVAYTPGQQAALAFGFRNKLRSLLTDGPDLPSAGRTATGRIFGAFRTVVFAAVAIMVALLALLLRRFAPRLWRKWQTSSQLRKVRRGEGKASDAALLYERMLESLARRGFQKPAWFTPTEFARHLPTGERELVGALTAVYNDVRFGGNPSGASQLAEMLDRIEAGR
jgi:transglutaminase-like putative cysteine protease